MLTETLPLAMTTELGAFAAAQPLPQRYGDLRKTRFKLIRMTATKFIAAGHPMQITRAFTGDLETKSFAVSTQTRNGRTFCQVEFAAPVPLGTECSASGIGKKNATTGALIENPADIAADILALAGRADPWFGQLRAECSALPLAGSFAIVTSIRDAIDVVIDSAGAIWCAGMARLYPIPFVDEFRIDLDRHSLSDVAVTAALTDTADILRMTFDYDEVEDRDQSFIQLEASPQRYAGETVDLSFPMVRNPAVAEAIGRRVLAWYAGERYAITGTVDLGAIPQGGKFVCPGTWALLTDHAQWPYAANPNVMITRAATRRRENSAVISGEVLRTIPTIALTGHSLGSNSIGAGGIEVDVRNGVATFTINDNDDRPLAGAYVSLDGAAPEKTNGQGQVSFITAAGKHELAIEAAGFVPFTIGVTL